MESVEGGVGVPVPTVGGVPLIGSALDLQRDLLGTHLRAMREYGDVVRFVAGPPGLRLTFYAVYHPDAVQRVLASESRRYRKDSVWYDEFRWAFGDGLLNSQDEQWVRQKRFVQPLFTRQQIAGYVPVMVLEATRILDRWHHAPGAGGVVDLHQDMTLLTFQIVARILFGTDLERVAPTVHTAFPILGGYTLKRGMAPVRTPRTWLTPANRRALRAQRTLYAVVDELITMRRAAGGGDDLLGRLLAAHDPETGAGLDNNEIRDQVLIFLLAGHETTATALTYALHLLGRHPDVQQRVRAEVDQVLGAQTPGPEHLAALSYTAMVLKETMRLYPSAFAFGRHTHEGDRIGEHQIPPGSDVYLVPWATHRHPQFWQDPERFDPERFTPERETMRHRYAWFPFGGGPRACIGQHFSMIEAVLALALAVRSYELFTPPGPVPLMTQATLRPAQPVPCHVTTRHQFLTRK